jgi:hypothetical protein
VITLCIKQKMNDEMRRDLRRSHPFAAERVGFVFVQSTLDGILDVTGYMAVPDELYINDPSVGASISHQAISIAMMRVFQTKEGILQVHEHGGRGVPGFSRTDLRSHPDFLQSFRNANSKGIHGFLLLSEDRMLTRYWPVGKERYVDSNRFTITQDSWWERIRRWLGL